MAGWLTGNGPFGQISLLITDTTVSFGGPEFDAFADFLAPSYEAFLLVWEETFYNHTWRYKQEEWLIDLDATLIVNAGLEEVVLFGGRARC
jgi:hypothetical protein